MEGKKLPLHERHVQLGAKMMPFAGFQMPVRYASDLEEHMTVRRAVGVFDISHMGEFEVSGPGALSLIQYVSSNDASALSIGQAQYACLPNETGGIVDDLVIYRLAEERYLLVVNAANIEKDWNWITAHNTTNAMLRNLSEDTGLLAVQGPQALKVVQSLTDIDLTSVRYYHFVRGMLAGIPDVLISNTGYTGAGGFELYVPARYVVTLWNELFRAGQAHGIKPIGLGARDTLRLEMGFCLYGNDLDDTTSPLEAGLGWITRFTKDFVHAAELKKQKETGVTRKLIGFQMIDKGIPRAGYPILDAGGQSIGRVTSGSISPVLNQGIGLGYVSTSHANPDSEIYISVRNQPLKATVRKPPFISK